MKLAEANDSAIAKQTDDLFPRGYGGCRVLYPGGQGQAHRGLAARQEAIVAILEEGAFFGESCLAGHTVRTATATSDDDSLVRQLHTQILTAYPDIEVVGQAATGDEAISYVQKLQPNIVILPGLRSMWSWSFPNMFSFPYIKKGLKA